MQMMMSKCSTGFDIGVCLGLHLGPHGCARCPVELGAGPQSQRRCLVDVCAVSTPGHAYGGSQQIKDPGSKRTDSGNDFRSGDPGAGCWRPAPTK